jgi:hypothetical protein
MDLNRLTRDADDLIRKVVSRYNQLYVPAGAISQLELDLMLDDLRKLYETFKNIGQLSLSLQDTVNKPEVKVNTAIPEEQKHLAETAPSYSEKPQQTREPVPATEQANLQDNAIAETAAKTIPEPESENGTEDIKNAEFLTETEYAMESLKESPFQPEPGITNRENPIPPQTETHPPVSTEPAPATLADRFNTGSKSLSDSMASAPGQGVMGSRLQFQPIADLTTGIGLNDKFSFISDLFGNSAAHYDEAITRINKAVNIDEAYWILQKYHSASWEQKQESLARLKDFVKRRFI